MEVNRRIFVTDTGMWHLLTGVPGDPYAVQEAGVLPGGRSPLGEVMPLEPNLEEDEIVADRTALEQILSDLGLRTIDPARSLFNLGWRGLRAAIKGATGLDIDQVPQRRPFTRIWYHRDDPQKRQN